MALPEKQQQAVLTICVMAAFADGSKSQAERDQVKSVAESLVGEVSDLPRIVQDVLLKRVDLAQVATMIHDPAQRTLAYEMALVVCEADGKTCEAEHAYLKRLSDALGLESASSQALIDEADQIATVALEPVLAMAGVAGVASHDLLAPEAIPEGEPTPNADPHEAVVDSMIIKYAILNGALELLPQNLATLAILPLQTKMVYRIGKQYGHSLDRRSIGEFIATLGMGATSQMLENVARKFIGKLGKSLAGGMGKSVGKTATGAAFSFGSTWAIGQLAKRYYRSGRSIKLSDLKAQSADLVNQGKVMFEQYRPQVVHQSQTIDTGQILSMVRGQ